MKSQDRVEWSEEHFGKIGDKVSALAYELQDNKDPKEFIDEMEELKKELEIAIDSFRKVV